MERLEALARFVSKPAGRAVFFAIIGVAASWPYLSNAGGLNDFRDAHILVQYEESARKTVADYGQVPLWNPYYCGGMYGLGTPQSRFASPTLLLSLIFGTYRAEAIAQLLLLLIGLEGAFRYLRSRGAKASSAVFAAPIFGLSGVFASAPFLGWANFYSFELLPWLVLAVRRGLRGDRRALIIAALSAPFMVGFGGTYAAPIAAVLCAVETVEALVVSKRREVVLARATTIALLALGSAAFRLWPVLETLARSPRIVGGITGPTIKEVTGLVWGVWPPGSPGGTWYLLGAPATIVAVLSFWRRRTRWLLAAILICLWLAVGYTLKPSLFGMLRSLPVFGMLRSPERFLIPAALLLAAMAAKTLDGLWASKRRNVWLRRTYALCLLLLLGNIALLARNFEVSAAARGMIPTPTEVHRPFHQARGNRWSVAYYAPMERGSLSCMDAYPVPQSPNLRGDLQHEAYLAEPIAGSVTENSWSPNAISVTAALSQPTKLIINQNHHTGWRANVGKVVNDRGLLAVELPAGTHDVTLRFLPVSAIGGALITLWAIALAVWFATKKTQLSPFVMAPLALACVLPGLVASSVMNEPKFEKEQPLAPDGAPLFVDQVRPNVKPVHVQFEGDVRLEGMALTENEADHTVQLELDWKSGAHPNPKLGVFVHIQPNEGDKIGADHALISESLSFEELPPNTLARDVATVVVAPEQRTRTWTVWAGLWALRGDGARMKVLDTGGLEMDADRILVGRVVRDAGVPDAGVADAGP